MKLNVIIATTLRHLVNTANEKGIQKDDIVAIKKLDYNEYALLFYES